MIRKLTDVHDYLEPFRRHGIRYVVEGERHFYAAKEIIDAVDLLRAVENPYDRLALVCVLRSPLGGLTDLQIYQLHRQNRLDYRDAAKLDVEEFPATLAQLYQALTRLNVETKILPIGAAVDRVFSTLPVELLAACHFHGEQAVANLTKLRQQAEQLGREDHYLQTSDSPARTARSRGQGRRRKRARRRKHGRRAHHEHPQGQRLGVPHRDSGRLPDRHRRTTPRYGRVSFDWSTGLNGMRIGRTADLAGLYITEKNRLRNAEEQKRLLYVAMTRAREHLVISCAPSGRRSRGSFQAMLDSTLDDSISTAQSSTRVSLGKGVVEIEVVHRNLSAPTHAPAKAKRSKTKPNWKPYVDGWARRTEIYEKARQTSPFLTPTLSSARRRRAPKREIN